MSDVQQQEFSVVCGSGGVEGLKQRALRGQLRDTTVRGLVWKLLLGVLPADIPSSQWPAVLAIHRKEYQALLTQYLIDPHEAAKELAPEISNPLSQSEQSPWLKFFENAELEKLIGQDIERTYPENEFFQSKRIRDMMLRILFIYARQTPQVSYKQGMHELLAPMLYVLQRECITQPLAGEGEELSKLFEASYVEHDAFTMFCHLMKHVKDWFDSTESTKKKEDPFGHPETSPIVEKCKSIQSILKQKDPELHQFLENMGIEPQLYMLRWVRLLLGREFHLEDLMILWDAIFSYSNDLELVDYLCVAMLMFIRHQLLDKDYTDCLRRLFKYPPVEDVHLFVEKALALIASETVEEEKVDEAKPASSKFMLDPLKQIHREFLHDDSNLNVQDLHRDVRRLKNTQLHMATRLERIIYSLQKEILERPIDSPATSDGLILSLAELKQIKDILSGLLPGPAFDETDS